MFPDLKTIARIGLAIEFTDGDKVVIYSDSPAEVSLETTNEVTQDPFFPYRVRLAASETEITISHLSTYTMYREGPQQDDPDTDKALTQIKELTGGRR